MRLNGPYLCIRSAAVGLLIASLSLAACSSSSSPTPTAVPAATPNPKAEAGSLPIEITRNIIYANVDELQTELDVYAPSDPGPWPVVVIAHGSGEYRSNFDDFAEAIASHGAVVYNIDYTLTLPTSIEDIACAVRFARTTAADYGGDPDWITLVGSSAGADLGVVIALAGDDFEGDCVVTDASALLDAFVGFEGFYNLDTAALVIPDLTILKDEDPELYEAVNPPSHIGRNPGLHIRLVHGDDVDTEWYDVPPEASIEFHQALADAGYDAELIIVEGASHDTLSNKFLNPDGFALTVQQVMELARGSSQ
jgi:acetyl esterase/lipase